MGRNRRKSGGDMYPWEGTQRKSEITQEDCILGSSSSSHRSGLIEGLWEVWTPLRGVFVLVCTQGRVERDLLTFLQLSHQAPQCSPSKQSDSAQSITAQHWKWGGHDRGKDWTVGYRGDGVLWGVVFVAAIAGIYSRSSSKHPGSPRVAALPHVTPSTRWEARHAPPAQQRFSTAGWGRQRSLAIIDYEEQRKHTAGVCPSRVTGACRGRLLKIWNRHEQRAYTGVTCFFTPLGQVSQGQVTLRQVSHAGREKTHVKATEAAQPWPSGFLGHPHGFRP